MLSHDTDIRLLIVAQYIEGIMNIRNFICNSCILITDLISNSPHTLPVKLLGVETEFTIEIRLIDVEIHHTWVWPSNLSNIGLAESATNLSRTTPLLNLSLYIWITALDHTSDHIMTHIIAIQISHHFANSTACIEFT